MIRFSTVLQAFLARRAYKVDLDDRDLLLMGCMNFPLRYSQQRHALSQYAACEVFGLNPGLVGAMAGPAGLPPEWSDKGGTATKVQESADR